MSHFLRKLLGLHGLLHDLWHCCRRLLCFALLKFIDLVSVVCMVGVIRVEEVKFWIVDLILTDSRLKLRPISVRRQGIRLLNTGKILLGVKTAQLTQGEQRTWQQS